MASPRGLGFLALILAIAYAARNDEIQPHVLFQTPPSAKEKAAQSLVASLLKERATHTVITTGDGSMQWVPASSLEAQEGEMSQEDAETEMRMEFEEALGKDLIGVFENDLQAIKTELEPTFMALPKNEYGELGHTAVRYALHRLFVARHGWYIQGIDPEGKSYDTVSPTETLKGLVPTNVQQLIEKLLYGRGFGLSEVAVLAAILENVIHQEAIARTKAVFKMFDMDVVQKSKSATVDWAIERYMAVYMAGKDITRLKKKAVVNIHNIMPSVFPSWSQTTEFLRETRSKLYNDKDLTFQEIAMLAVEVSEKHGRFQQAECVDLKKQLMGLEDSKDGCVPAAKFYDAMATQGKWQFSESPGYLEELGALDASDPHNLRVMIPNYINGASNCVATSSYYSVCCRNEGEEILGRIEKHFQHPDATPGALARVVSALPSSTVPADRTLPQPLVEKLEKIAAVHGGRVPLQSRLFMQWLHNAYPHEVPYPQVAGASHPRLPEVYMAEEHELPNLSQTEAQEFMDFLKADKATLHKQGACGQWLSKEELYVPWQPHAHPAAQEMARRLDSTDAHIWAGASSLALFAAMASMILMAVQGMRSVRSATKSNQMKKMIVT